MIETPSVTGIALIIKLSLHRYDEARTDALSALYLSAKLVDRPTEADLRLILGLGFLFDAKYDDAIAALESALLLHSSSFQNAWYAPTLWALGAAREKRGDAEGAITAYRRAVEVFDSGLVELKSDQFQAGLGESALTSYNRLARLLALRGDIEEAFLLSERSRARVTQRYMGSPPAYLKGADPALLREHDELRSRIGSLSAGLESAQRRLSSLYDSEALVSLARELDDARRNYGTLLTRIQELSPAAAALRQPSTRSVGEIQKLLDADTTLIKYLLLADDAFAWVLNRDSIHLVRLKLTSSEAEAMVQELRALISAHKSIGAQAYRLYQLLFATLQPFIHNDKLYLVPDGALQELPFAALRDTLTGGPLFERYSVSILPSASVLPFVLRKRQAGSSRMLALGDPDGSLPGAAAEARAAAVLYGTQALLGEKATVKAITGAAQNIDILHIAAHATSDPARPLFSRLKLADGALNVSDILQLDLSAVRLVVLSGCETGTGVATGPGEFGGLSRAFLLAGAPAVIATLWPVDDRASRYFMDSFYTHLKTGKDQAQALRQAQSALLQSAEWRHPSYWAGFILSGALLSPASSAIATHE